MNKQTTNNQNTSEDEKNYVLTAIVLVYNGEHYLEACLKSLVNQTLDDLEILLINDASTDDSLSICREFERTYENVRLVNKEENEGLASSANLGISLAKGEYIILVDNDDIIPSYAYEKLYKKAKETNADICTGKANFLRERTQFEFDFRENYVWEKERVITDVNDFPEIFEDSYYWNKIIRKELLIKNDIKLPDGMIYADRHFAHNAFIHANKIAVIPDCVYLWRQIKSSLSQQRRTTDNYINRLDSYDLDLDSFIDSCDIYFKFLLRRIIVPIRGILNSEEFEDVVFERVQPLIKIQEDKFENLYDNDLNQIDNICAYLISNNHRLELKKLLQLDLKYQREVYTEDGVSYWKLPLFRNPNIPVPDELFKIRYLLSQFVTIDNINITKDKISFSNIRIPEHLPIKDLQIALIGLTDQENVFEENTLTFDLKVDENGDDLSYSTEISSESLANFELYDVFLKCVYEDGKFNYIRLNDVIIEEINGKTNNMKSYLTPIGNLSLISQNMDNQFEIDCDENKLKVNMRNKQSIKKNLRMLVRKDSTNELIHLSLNDEGDAFELEWKYFLDPRSSYLLFITVFNDNAKIRRNVRFKEKLLDEFCEKSVITDNNLDVPVYKADNGDIRIKSL